MCGASKTLRTALIAAVLVLGTAGAADATNLIKVSFSGVLSTDPATTIQGWFQYDADKPVDVKLGKPINGQFTFTGSSFSHYLRYTASKGGTTTDDLPATSGNACVILTNIDPMWQKFQVTLTEGGKTYVVKLMTPNKMTDQKHLPVCNEFPVCTMPGTNPGTGTLVKTSGGSTTTYSIYVTACK